MGTEEERDRLLDLFMKILNGEYGEYYQSDALVVAEEIVTTSSLFGRLECGNTGNT